jgi:hypothetical protein
MAEDLVLRDQGSGRAVGDHEAGIKAAFTHQKGRQFAQHRIHQPLDPALAHRRQFMNTFLFF